MKEQFGPDPPGATPLDLDDLEGLLPTWVATRSDLNAAEDLAIAKATAWSASRSWKPATILDPATLQSLHRRMFRGVWRWAGQWRVRETNIGVAPHLIQSNLRNLLDDAVAWVALESYESDEIAVRFHHRLVSVHPFPNGNGRHARLAADVLAVGLGQQPFTWGRSDLGATSAARDAYLAALRIADREYEYRPLLTFARA